MTFENQKKMLEHFKAIQKEYPNLSPDKQKAINIKSINLWVAKVEKQLSLKEAYDSKTEKKVTGAK